MTKKKKGKKQRKISLVADGKCVEYTEEELINEFASTLSELLDKKEPFILIITPLKGKCYSISSPEVMLLLPQDVLLLEAKSHRSVIELFDEIISIRSKLEEYYKEYHKKPHYIS